MATSDQQPPARTAEDDPVAATGHDERTEEALARSRELRSRSRRLLAETQRIAPAAQATSSSRRRQAGTGSGPRPGGQPRPPATMLDQQIGCAKATRVRLAALAAELADTEDNVARVHDQLAAERGQVPQGR